MLRQHSIEHLGELDLRQAVFLAQLGDTGAKLLEKSLLVVGHGRATAELAVLYLAHTVTLAMRNAVDYTPKLRIPPHAGQAGRATVQQAFTLALGAPGPFNTTKAQHFFFANNQQVGSFGQLTDDGQFQANFDVNYTPVSDHYSSATVSEVVVQQGDTLQGIAARVYGDSTLWYLIAEENGLTDPSSELTPGSVLRIPNEVVSLSNTATSFKPFDVQDAIGDTTPVQPMPQPNINWPRNISLLNRCFRVTCSFGSIASTIIGIASAQRFGRDASHWDVEEEHSDEKRCVGHDRSEPQSVSA